MRLAIGCAQMGMVYGVANRSGQVGPEQAALMLRVAREIGVDTVDTAAAYGESEAVLGSAGVRGMKVVTKLAALPFGCDDPAGWVERSVVRSCERLQVESLHSVLVHRGDDLLGPNGSRLVAGLDRIRAAGLCSRVGVSVYTPHELREIERRMRLDMVQLPRSPFDRRFERAGCLEHLQAAGIWVHARSIFLQGLLVMPADGAMRRFGRWGRELAAWQAWLLECGMTAVEACIRDALACPHLERVVIGFDGVDQLHEACEFMKRTPVAAPDVLGVDDLDLLLPSRWSAS